MLTSAAATVVTFSSAAAVMLFLVMWAVNTIRHRSHLAQCWAWLYRLNRLDRRLTGCVTEIERYLEQRQESRPGWIPEAIVGQHRYLFSLRQELEDLTSELRRHAHRLRWPDGYLNRKTLAGQRCELAHESLARSTTAMGSAAREFDRMLATTLRGDEPQGRHHLDAADAALLLLGGEDPSALSRLRVDCQEGMRAAGDVLAPGARHWNTIDCTWPIWRSELSPGGDPYRGEVRPIAWTGFGDQPLPHVDAR